MELNFTTFAKVVDAIGGIDMYFPMKIFDAYSSLNIERAGCYHLDGIHALEVVRARHLQIDLHPAVDGTNPRDWPYEPESDLARIRRTHEFLRVVAAKISGMGIGNPSSDLSLATTLLPDLTVDDSFNEGEMVSLAEAFHAVSISAVPQDTYPVVLNFSDPANGYSYLYKGGFYGDVEFPVQPGGWQTEDQIFGVQPGSAPGPATAAAAGAFHVSVVDGSDVPNQQTTIAAQLRGKGFDVTATGVRTPVGSAAETVVWYGGPPPPPNADWPSASLEAALARHDGPRGPGHPRLRPRARPARQHGDGPDRQRRLRGDEGLDRATDHHHDDRGRRELDAGLELHDDDPPDDPSPPSRPARPTPTPPSPSPSRRHVPASCREGPAGIHPRPADHQQVTRIERRGAPDWPRPISHFKIRRRPRPARTVLQSNVPLEDSSDGPVRLFLAGLGGPEPGPAGPLPRPAGRPR